MRADELDFHLPTELIAQAPTPDRAASRLLHYKRADRSVEHAHFSDVEKLLRPGDLLVFNDARVLAARFMLRKETSGLIEGLFLNQPTGNRWQVLLRNLGNYGDRPLEFVDSPGLIAAGWFEPVTAANMRSSLTAMTSAIELLNRIGRMPLPPYIRREKGRDARDDDDRQRYQTVYAKSPGAVAAPTAGLHFTPELIDRLDRAGIERAFVTLHVGLGTFKPVTAETLEGHRMHVEAYSIDRGAAEAAESREGGGTTDRGGGNDFGPRVGESVRGRILRPEGWRDVNLHLSAIHLAACRRDDHQLPSATKHADRNDRRVGGTRRTAADLSDRD